MRKLLPLMVPFVAVLTAIVFIGNATVAAIPRSAQDMGAVLTNDGGAVYVVAVQRNSQAERCGLKPGDVVRALDDKLLADIDDFDASLAELDVKTMTVDRDGEEVHLQLRASR